MMPAPEVTVVTICRNAVAHIEVTLRSVLEQTARGAMQYVVVDGASTDGTLEVLRRHGSGIDVLISEPDRGISDAFNKGVRASAGRWIVFMNGGDRFAHANAVSRALAVARPELDVVYGQCVLETPTGAMLGVAGKPFSARAFRARMTLPHQSTFHNRALFDRFGLFDERFKVAMDYDLLLRPRRPLRTAYLPEPVAVMLTGGVSQSDDRRAYVEYRAAQIRNGIPVLEAHASFAYMMAKSAGKQALRRAGLGWLVKRLRAIDA